MPHSDSVDKIFSFYDINIVYNLAAQAGVRYSISHPHKYTESNIEGFLNILECCKGYDIEHLIYASSSSVYGLNKQQPYSVHDNVDHPASLYAATKKSNELMAHTYAYLHDLPATGLRFFTVYGPWGRPDMAYFSFVRKIVEHEVIEIYNNGDMARDFTYIDDIVESLYRLKNTIPSPDNNWDSQEPDPSKSPAPFRIYNIGNNKPINLMDFVNIIQEKVGQKAELEFLPMQPGDVKETWADSSELYQDIDYSPNTNIEEGISKFVDWYFAYHEQKVLD